MGDPPRMFRDNFADDRLFLSETMLSYVRDVKGIKAEDFTRAAHILDDWDGVLINMDVQSGAGCNFNQAAG